MVNDDLPGAVLIVDANGRYLDADTEALELLGVSLPELVASPSDRFVIEPRNEADQAAFRTEWLAGGAKLLVGTAGMRRADGRTIRVAYALEPLGEGFRARLWPVEGSPHLPVSAYTVGAVLKEWRAAERKLADLVPGTPAWARTLVEIQFLRDRYQELFSVAETQPHPGDEP
ncbi:MAG TPA: PAS domain-containing protein [Candidatus Limnocylindrales bacterium]|jgi:PAS domain-containing protein